MSVAKGYSSPFTHASLTTTSGTLLDGTAPGTGPYHWALISVWGRTDVSIQWQMWAAGGADPSAQIDIFSSLHFPADDLRNPLTSESPYWHHEVTFDAQPSTAAPAEDKRSLSQNSAAFLLVRIQVLANMPDFSLEARAQGRGH